MQKIVMTRIGKQLIAELTSSNKMTFSGIKTSEKAYTESEVENLENLEKIKQEVPIISVDSAKNGGILLNTKLENTELERGYYIKSIGIYANAHSNEILIAVAVNDTPDFLCAPLEGPASITYKIGISVISGDNVEIVIPKSASPTIEQHLELEEKLTKIERESEIFSENVIENIEKLKSYTADKETLDQTKTAIDNVKDYTADKATLDAIKTLVDALTTALSNLDSNAAKATTLSAVKTLLENSTYGLNAIKGYAADKATLDAIKTLVDALTTALSNLDSNAAKATTLSAVKTLLENSTYGLNAIKGYAADKATLDVLTTTVNKLDSSVAKSDMVQTINSSNIPLNILTMVTDIHILGEVSYAYKNKAFYNDILRCYQISMNDDFIVDDAFALAIAEKKIGIALTNIYDINYDFSRFDTMNAVANSEVAMNVVANSEVAMNVVANSEVAMNVVANSEVAMNVVTNSEVAMNVVTNSEVAMNVVANSEVAMNVVTNSEVAMNAVAKADTSNLTNFYKQINTKLSYISNVYNCLKNTSYFTPSTKNSQDTVNALNTNGNTKNSIIAIATGYYSSSSQTTNVFMYGTQISDGKLVNTYRPSVVSSSNIGAISAPVTTFTETGDGYAAIAVYVAI